jgi:hypothetical protein
MLLSPFTGTPHEPAPRSTIQTEIVEFQEQARLVSEYVQYIDTQQKVGSYLVEVAREQAEAEARARAEAEERARQVKPAPAPAPRYSTPPTNSGGGGCGGATNGADQYIGRETKGSSDPVNQANLQGSGAWGCYQITPSTWAASCGDLGSEIGSSGSTQAACASRLPISAWANP